MQKKELIKFDDNTIIAIRNFIAKLKETPTYSDHFLRNIILRENVFDILESCCTAIYYPLPDEENDGFHISYPVKYQDSPAHFVYLNTAKPIEKLVFAAGHELGHIWKVDQVVASITQTAIPAEDLMNRFSAELLMPEDVFKPFAEQLLEQKVDRLQDNLFLNLLGVSAVLMNEFCVPFQAVVRRLWECGKIGENTVNLLLFGPETMPDGVYSSFLEDFLRLCKENDGYGRIGIITEKKSIPGFAQLLQDAENSHKISPLQIAELRKQFDIKGSIKGAENFKDILKEL